MSTLEVKTIAGVNTLGVNTITDADGNNSSTTSELNTATQYRAGEMIERIVGNCDGRTVVGLSGSYTLANVTTSLAGTTSYQDITGSSINYTPPAGTKKVHYKFTFHWDVTENSGISHYRIIFDGTEIIPAYQCHASNYASTNWNHYNGEITMEYVIQTDHTSDDKANGRINGWTTSKNIHCEFREYSGSYEVNLHYNTWRDGTGASGNYRYRKPTLEVTAYA